MGRGECTSLEPSPNATELGVGVGALAEPGVAKSGLLAIDWPALQHQSLQRLCFGPQGGYGGAVGRTGRRSDDTFQ